MYITNLLFKLIKPTFKKGGNWLSYKFARWNQNRLRGLVLKYKRLNSEEFKYFDVKGAGEIRISESCHYCCGGKVGFDFAVEWSDSPFVGGVLGRDEAVKIANFILKRCSNITMTMDEELGIIQK